MEMVLEYARVFPENADMGNPDGIKLQKDIAKKGGQYVVNLYFTDYEQIEKLTAEGLDLAPLGHKRIIDGNANYGVGKYMKAKRDNKKGGTTDVNYGGPIGVVDLRDPANKRWWSFTDDGALGNGTKAMVQFETYSDGAGIRLVNIGITEHVPYENNEGNYSNNELFKVA
jgi:hypothetical protein